MSRACRALDFCRRLNKFIFAFAELPDGLLCLFFRYALRVFARQSFHRHYCECLRIVSYFKPPNAPFFEFKFFVRICVSGGNFAHSFADFRFLFVGNDRNTNKPSGIAVFFADFVRLLHHANRLPRALFLGCLIPGIIYALWMIYVLKTASEDPMFWQRLRAHAVSVGELIAFLCDRLPYASVGAVLKTVTALGVVTSAIGYGIGLLQSLQNLLPKPLARFFICFLPAVINLFAPNLFIHILTFIGMISAVFTIFVPYYLTVRHMKQHSLSGSFCFLFGLTVVICEILYEWK